MSFYGKIINYVTNAFAKINGNDTLEGNEIKFSGDDVLSVDVTTIQENGSKTIEINYAHNQRAPRENDFSTEYNTDANTVDLLVPQIDKYGHSNGNDLQTVRILKIGDDGNGNIFIKVP